MDAAPGQGCFRDVPYMGVIYVVAEAAKLGFYNGNPDWANLGQGQPEIGPMEGAPERIGSIDLQPGDHAYGPINGTDEMRQVVAAHYNRLYRQGKESQYGAENVAVAAGGRLALTRIFAALRAGKLGYQIPDYTAYEDMIDAHRDRLTPVLFEPSEEEGFAVTPEVLRRRAADEGLDAFMVSNPCNPTGRVLDGEELEGYVGVARDQGVTLVLDEFYSHFIYTEDGEPGTGPVSAARYVEDVNEDPVLLVDGLTKSFRYPGWRLGWVVGPAPMIDTLGRAASAIDGGPCQPVQRAALQVLEPERADQETRAVREVFAAKRRVARQRLGELGVTFAPHGRGTFYLWGSIAGLPAPLNDGERFFREALKRKVMTVPGAFFDVNPGKARTGRSPFTQWTRFSFGPPMDNLQMGLDRLAELVEDARAGKLDPS